MRTQAFTQKMTSLSKQAMFLQDFHAQHYRLFHTGTVAEVDYINDAMAGNANATYFSMANTYKPMVWIVNATIDMDYSLIAQRFGARIRGIVCLGACHQDLRQHFTQMVPIVEVEDIEKATYTAQRLAKQGDMVLFSPMYHGEQNAESYGVAFDKAVNEL